MKRKIFELLILMCVIFTVVTFFESSIQLMFGQQTDENVHILNRMSYAFIGALSISLVKNINMKHPFLDILVPYLITTPLMILSVFITSLYMFMPNTAYRDALFFFTLVFFVVGYLIVRKKKSIPIEHEI